MHISLSLEHGESSFTRRNNNASHHESLKVHCGKGSSRCQPSASRLPAVSSPIAFQAVPLLQKHLRGDVIRCPYGGEGLRGGEGGGGVGEDRGRLSLS